MKRDIITVGYNKGEMDFGVNTSIKELTLKEMNELRIMTIVAIGQAEAMWHNHQEVQPMVETSRNIFNS